MVWNCTLSQAGFQKQQWNMGVNMKTSCCNLGNTSFPARHFCFPKQNFWFPKREQVDLWQGLLIMKHFTSGWRHSCIVTARLAHWQHDRLTAEKSLQTIMINQRERYFTKKHWTWLNTGTVWLMFILAPKQTLIQQKLTVWFIISINHSNIPTVLYNEMLQTRVTSVPKSKVKWEQKYS